MLLVAFPNVVVVWKEGGPPGWRIEAGAEGTDLFNLIIVFITVICIIIKL